LLLRLRGLHRAQPTLWRRGHGGGCRFGFSGGLLGREDLFL
jgi:hypothetical protein